MISEKVIRAILSLLVFTLVACEPSLSDGVADPDGSSDSDHPPVMLSLLQRLPDGQLVPVHGPVSPSLPCPEISVSAFDVANLRKARADAYGYICDISISGTVKSSICDVIPGNDGVIEEIRLFHNGGDRPVGSFPVEGDKTHSDDQLRPFPFEGHFDFTAKAIPVIEGNNTFRIVSRDSIYGLDGHSLWAASFAFPYEDELEANNDDSGKEPTVVKGPQFVAGGSGGELSLYGLGLKNGTATDRNMRLTFDGGIGFTFKAIDGTEYLIPAWPDTASPALFTLRPTMAIPAKVPSDAKVVSALNSHPVLASLSPENRFLYGLSQGLGFEGYDIVFDSDHLIRGGVRLSKSLRTLEFSVGLADAGETPLRGEVEVGAIDSTDSPPAGSPGSTPSMLWHFANLFRTSDPRADEVVLALLLGDLADVGLEEVSIADWREYFYMCFSEALEKLIKGTVTESESGQGYYVGRVVGDALRTNVDPTLPGRLDETGKAGFLSKLTKMPCFNPRGRARMALKSKRD